MAGGGERAPGLREPRARRGGAGRRAGPGGGQGRHISVLSHCRDAEQGSRELGGLFPSVLNCFRLKLL